MQDKLAASGEDPVKVDYCCLWHSLLPFLLLLLLLLLQLLFKSHC